MNQELLKIQNRLLGLNFKDISDDKFIYIAWIFITQFLLPEYVWEKPHLDMLTTALKSKESLILAGRELGKSTLFIGLWILLGLREPYKRHSIFSYAWENSLGKLTIIHNLFKNHYLLNKFFPNSIKKVNLSSGMIWLKGNRSFNEEGTFCIGSVNSTQTGKHFERFLGDDLVTFKSCRTEKQREFLTNWKRFDLAGMIKSADLKINIGNRYHEDDEYGKMLGIPIDYIFEGKKPNMKTNFQSWDCLTKDGRSCYPKRHNMEFWNKLILEYTEPVFNAQFRQDVRSLRGSLCKMEWIETTKEHPDLTERIISIDFAASEKEKADESALVCLGLSETGFIHIPYCISGLWDYPTLLNSLESVIKLFSPKVIIAEQAGQQEMIISALRKSLRTMNYTIPIIPRPRNIDMVTLFHSISSYFQANYVVINEYLTNMINQLLSFPESSKNDILSALFQGIAYLVNRQIIKKPDNIKTTFGQRKIL